MYNVYFIKRMISDVILMIFLWFTVKSGEVKKVLIHKIHIIIYN